MTGKRGKTKQKRTKRKLLKQRLHRKQRTHKKQKTRRTKNKKLNRTKGKKLKRKNKKINKLRRGGNIPYVLQRGGSVPETNINGELLVNSGHTLGVGDNEVYLGRYNSEHVAIKVFKNRANYESALEIYDMLKDVKFKRGPDSPTEYLGGVKIDDGKIIAGLIGKDYVAILEYIKGSDLYENIVERMGIPREECIGFVVDILKQLIPLHMKEFAHRDIKPENVMLDTSSPRTQFARLIDYDMTSTCLIGMRDPFKRKGTIDYVAPEVMLESMRKDLTDFRPTDMFSLGVTIVSMVVGANPWDVYPRSARNIKRAKINPDFREKLEKFGLYDLVMNLVNENPKIRLNAWNTYILLTNDDPNNILPDDLQGKISIDGYPEISGTLLAALEAAKSAAKAAATDSAAKAATESAAASKAATESAAAKAAAKADATESAAASKAATESAAASKAATESDAAKAAAKAATESAAASKAATESAAKADATDSAAKADATESAAKAAATESAAKAATDSALAFEQLQGFDLRF
jgi:serine/threonine protein kinase